MSFTGVVDAWMTDLTTNVSGLRTSDNPGISTDNRHKYAIKSVELLAANVGERHIAIWPQEEPEVASAAIISTQGADLSAQSYLVTVWEESGLEAARLQDDEAGWSTFEALYEATRARFYVSANRTLGSVDTTQYGGGTFGVQGGIRFFVLRFQTRQFLSYS